MLKDRKMSFASDFSDTISFQQHSGERTSVYTLSTSCSLSTLFL